jgi:hypothetical protein
MCKTIQLTGISMLIKIFLENPWRTDKVGKVANATVLFIIGYFDIYHERLSRIQCRTKGLRAGIETNFLAFKRTSSVPFY